MDGLGSIFGIFVTVNVSFALESSCDTVPRQLLVFMATER